MKLQIELEREADGRWIAEVPDLAGVMAYGQTRDEALARVQALALRVIEGSRRSPKRPAMGPRGTGGRGGEGGI